MTHPTLPPRADAKFTALVDIEAAAAAIVNDTLRRMAEARSQLNYAPHGPKAPQLHAELNRLESLLSTHQDRLQIAGQLLNTLRHFLTTLPPNVILKDAELPNVHPREGETHLDAVSRVRQTVYSLQLEMRQVMRAGLPKSDLKASIRRLVTQLAKDGEPRVTFKGDRAELNFGTPGSFVPKPNVAAALAWLDAGRMIEQLEAQIDATAEIAPVMSASEKETRLGDIKEAMLQEEIAEEALISDAELDQITISRRPSADPRAVLSIVVTSKEKQVA